MELRDLLLHPVRTLEDEIKRLEAKIRMHVCLILVGFIIGIALTWVPLTGLMFHMVPAVAGVPSIVQEIVDKVFFEAL